MSAATMIAAWVGAGMSTISMVFRILRIRRDNRIMREAWKNLEAVAKSNQQSQQYQQQFIQSSAAGTGKLPR